MSEIIFKLYHHFFIFKKTYRKYLKSKNKIYFQFIHGDYVSLKKTTFLTFRNNGFA